MSSTDLFRQLNRMQRDLDHLFDDGGRRWAFPFSQFSFLPGRSARTYPLLNVSENADGFNVEALAPGVDPATLKISVVRDQLTIEGEKTHALKDVKREAVHRNERAAGRFVRTLKLGTAVDQEKVKAEYRDGILHLTLPKAESAKPRQIAVNVA